MNFDEKLVDRRRLEEAKETSTKEYAEFVAKADESLSALLKQIPAGHMDVYGYHSRPREISELEILVSKARNLAWALRTFPIFDPSCLRMMRKEKGLKVHIKGAWSGDPALDIQLDIWVPVFASGPVSTQDIVRASFVPTIDSHAGYAIDRMMVEENQREIHAKFKNGSITLHATCPSVPAVIIQNLNRLAGRFERTEIVWEAQWSAYAEVKDPLIIGIIGNTSFLIDQFDATKLERYVMSEFCARPKQP